VDWSLSFVNATERSQVEMDVERLNNYFLSFPFLFFFFPKPKSQVEKVEVNYERLKIRKKCFSHESQTGPHQSEIRLLIFLRDLY
jgi:hypothetical protein